MNDSTWQSQIVSRYSTGAPLPGNLYRHLTDWEIAKRFAEFDIVHPTNEQYNKWRLEGWAWRNGDPMVYWLDGGSGVDWGESWQWLHFDLNPGIDPDKWKISCRHDIAFHNKPENGFEKNPGDPLKRNYIKKQNTNSAFPLRQDKVRVCGNSVIHVTDINGDWGIVETLDGNQPAPPLQWVKDRPYLWFHAVSVHETRDKTQNISPFLFNDPLPTIYPLIATTQIKVFMPALQPVSECPPNPKIDYPVDPYRTYLYT